MHRLMRYNWETPDWPAFRWNEKQLTELLDEYENLVFPLLERNRLLPKEDRFNLTVELLVEEATNTSSIEGEYFQPEELKSSVVNNITNGLSGKASRSRRVQGISELVALVRKNFDKPLTQTTLKYWHETLLGYDDRLRVIGDYRKGPDPMQIVSGSFQRRIVHFEAPPASSLDEQMKNFIDWLDTPWPSEAMLVREGALRAGIAHIYFESIHPFEDGNGRIGRAISDKILGMTLGVPTPFSLSKSIQARQKDYYAALNIAQKEMDVTGWLTYFLEVLVASVRDASAITESTAAKTQYFASLEGDLEARHKKALLKMWGTRPKIFQGGMTTRKYTSITRASRATAARDLTYLTKIGALEKRGTGRSTHYVLPGTEE